MIKINKIYCQCPVCNYGLLMFGHGFEMRLAEHLLMHFENGELVVSDTVVDRSGEVDIDNDKAK